MISDADDNDAENDDEHNDRKNTPLIKKGQQLALKPEANKK